jgi:hypothetical protein
MNAGTISRKRGLRTKRRNTSPKRAVLLALVKYRTLQTKDLAYLLKTDNPEYKDLRAINATLHILDMEGMVCWKEITEHHGPGKRTHPYLWGLTDKAVKEYGGRSFDERRDWEHEYGLALFRIDLENVCEANGWELFWQQYDIKKGVDPDAYFRITTPGGAFHYFLEKERQKPSHHKQFKKWSIYFEYFNSDHCMKDWKFNRFRVIIVENTVERRDHLVNTLATVPIHEPKCKWFPPRNGKCDCDPRIINHRMFWLTTEDDHSENMGGKIFYTPKHDVYSFTDTVSLK